MNNVTRRTVIAGAAATTLPLRARAQNGTAPRAVRIGVLTDMSGSNSAASGPASVACARQAVEEFGSKAFPIEVLVADHQNKSDIGVTIARQWFDRDGIDMILDVPNSGVALAVNSLAREKNKTYVNCGGSTADLTGKSCTPNTIHWSYDTFMMSTAVGGAVTKAGGDKWFFITVDLVAGHQFQRDTSAIVTRLGGKVVGAALHPFAASDFSSFLLQAQASGANVIGLANAADDTINCVKQAHEFGLTANGTKLAAIFGSITVAHGIGIETAEGLLMAESFYWDLNDRTRAFAKRVRPKTPNNMPNAIHAACYGGTLHYLKALDDLGVDRKGDGAAVIARMKAMPAEDDCFGKTIIRADGRAMVTPYLLQVKKPSESKGEWDLFNVLSSIPADETAEPVTTCPLVKA